MPKLDPSLEKDFHGDGQSSADREEHGELKALIDAIAAQLSDATRQHSETLTEMQDRIATMGREAEALRDHIPERFAPAFEHIESGVAELARRLARANDPDAGLEQSGGMSSGEHGGAALADSVAWDRDSAEALSHVYDADAAEQASRPQSFSAGYDSASASIDQSWFEARFSEIAKGIDQSLEDIKPDRSLHAIGQRLDLFELQFTQMLAGLAKSTDLDAVRLIEGHVGEVVNHLVHTQDQLARLNTIEDQLAVIASTLSEERAARVSAPAGVDGAAAIDVGEIARAAAEQAAKRFADMAPASDDAASELRPLLERMMEESRTDGENTAALLDTLQQAMIRLLDRVDALEFAQRKETPLHARSFGDSFPAQRLDPEPPFPGSVSESDLSTPRGGAAPAVISEIVPPERAQAAAGFPREGDAEAEVRGNEKLRQDFIAEARRAKKRLASSSDDDLVVTSPSESGAFTMSSSSDASRGPMGGKPIRPTAARQTSSGPSGPSPRLIVLAVAVVLALGGLWFTVGSEPQVSAGSAVVAPSADAPKSADGKSNPDSAGHPGSAPGQDRDPKAGQQGQLMPGATGTTQTDVSMLGVSIDMGAAPASVSEMEKAQRHQAMAAMSGKLGDAAARDNSAGAVPASMIPSEAETEGQRAPDVNSAPAAALGGMRTDLPVATVGPLSLRLAAANGDPSAQFEVGARLAEGKGTPQDFKEAAKWYQRSADQGLAQAQYRLGTFYERGLGVKADRSLAEALYKRAADQGSVKAMHNLAVLSANQTDQAPDYTTAAHWFEQAAQRGLADSQFNLAILYENGLGVRRDMKQAYLWISLAARDKDSDAVRRQGILRGKLTADELSAADKMLADWKPLPVDHRVNDARRAGEEWKRNPKNGVAG